MRRPALSLSRPMRARRIEGWIVVADVCAGAQWARLRIVAPDGSRGAVTDTALLLVALSAATVLLRELGTRDTTIGDAAELVDELRQGDEEAADQVDRITAAAEEGDEEALDAAAALLDAADAAELLDAASAGDPGAMQAIAELTHAAEEGDPEAERAELHLCAPALVGFPTLDLGAVDLSREDAIPGALRRIRAALRPMDAASRLATAQIRALGRGAAP